MNVELSGQALPCVRIFCIGNNYREHVKEFADNKPEPLFFMKPAASIVPPGETLHSHVAGYDVHYEAEVTVLLGKEGRPQTVEEAVSFVAGLGIGLDLTLRDLQINRLRPERLPWETAKAFEGSAPLSPFTPFDPKCDDLHNLPFQNRVDGVLCQDGNTQDMILSIPEMILYLAKFWYLRPGDVIFTGTPKGVGTLVGKHLVELRNHRGTPYIWHINE
ncbi:MAG: fumarylacetoacetate hydrolase family protein [Victivallales bacterium]|nr:fumarylacetoacetate hydrolase family protein [Victivallales bacterium]